MIERNDIMKSKLALWGIIGALLVGITIAQGLNNKITSNEPKVSQVAFITLATGTAAACASTDTMFTSATFYGVKTVANNAAPTANGASAYLGWKDTAAVAVTVNTPVITDTITAGSSVILRATPGQKYNLANIYVLGTTGDKVLIIYEQ